MKRFKDLIKENLTEWNSSNGIVPGLNMPTVADSEMQSFNIENPEVLEQINAYLQTKLNERQWLNPQRAILMSRAKLNLIGLDFPCYPQRMGVIEDGTVLEYPLTQFGGRYGWDMDKGMITQDDGITHRLGYPLKLEASFTKTPNGLYEIDIAIVPALDEGLGDVEESVEESIDLSFLKEFAENISDDNQIREDKVAARELQIFIENDAQIYKRRLLPAYKNLITKMAREQYDSRKAAKLFMYTVNDAAKQYAKDFGGEESNTIFDKKTKEMVATDLVKGFEAEAKLGNYNDLLPKKYQ